MRHIIFFLYVILILAVSVLLFLFLRKKGKIPLAVNILLCVGAFLLLTAIISLFPLDCALLHFDTPEAALHYMAIGDLEDAVYGQDSCLLLYRRMDGVQSGVMVPFEDGKFKVPQGGFNEILYQGQVSKGGFWLFHAGGTRDYYISGSELSRGEEPCVISDNRGSVIRQVEESSPNVSDYRVISYYAFVYDWDEDYELTVNGEKTKMVF